MAKTYNEKLKDPRWQKKRLEIMNRDNFKCTLCGDAETTLNIHHLSYTGNPWEVDSSELKTVCEHCHAILEFYKKEFEGRVPLKIMKRLLTNKTDYFICIIENEAYSIGALSNGQFTHHIGLYDSALKATIEFFTNK